MRGKGTKMKSQVGTRKNWTLFLTVAVVACATLSILGAVSWSANYPTSSVQPTIIAPVDIKPGYCPNRRSDGACTAGCRKLQMHCDALEDNDVRRSMPDPDKLTRADLLKIGFACGVGASLLVGGMIGFIIIVAMT